MRARVAPQQLSGRTGSYMYMAPEMYRMEPYNEKVRGTTGVAQQRRGAGTRPCPPTRRTPRRRGRGGLHAAAWPGLTDRRPPAVACPRTPSPLQVDVFSFGVIMFEVMGRYQMVCAISHAGIESEIEAYVEKVSNGFRPAIPQQWPEALRHLIEDCWAQDPVSTQRLLRACTCLVAQPRTCIPISIYMRQHALLLLLLATELGCVPLATQICGSMHSFAHCLPCRDRWGSASRDAYIIIYMFLCGLSSMQRASMASQMPILWLAGCWRPLPAGQAPQHGPREGAAAEAD